LKYLVKGSELATWPAEQILEFVVAIYRKRFFFSFGSLFHEGAEIRRELLRQKKPAADCECGANDFVFETEQQSVLKELRQQRKAGRACRRKSNPSDRQPASYGRARGLTSLAAASKDLL
jgi:hypothetical protein